MLRKVEYETPMEMVLVMTIEPVFGTRIEGKFPNLDVEEAMKNFKPPATESGDADPFLTIMGKDYDGRRRLYGRGVTSKMLKKISGAQTSSYMVSEEVFESLRSTAEIEQRYHRDKAELEHLQK
ncbi:hypothetical protein ZIOFF_069858 [Zingiber officinale]|uniref:Uncharacterized protein n=1 Tax=Zingiber officinale TaxID=94328 RepID=A0A8J5BHT9_ZINOF|nr:hypothetical protein ZIOFF_069858 [Zingiber officinale]